MKSETEEHPLTTEEAEARARRLRVEYDMQVAAGQRDAGKLIRIPRENEIIQAEQHAVRLRRRQQDVARFRTGLAEVSVLAAAAGAAVASVASISGRGTNLYSLAALLFLVTSFAALAPYALAASRKRPGCERFGKADWFALGAFFAGIVSTSAAVFFGR